MSTKFRKIITVTLLQLFVANLLFPLYNAFALTNGPSQPEFSKFEPVSTTNMVNPLTGQFTYNLPVLNIPGPNGSGYPLSLSYHSGSSPEEEASWVGSGWTLNPGAINRVKRGFPDDYAGEEVTYWNRTTPNLTVSATGYINAEAYSQQPFSATASIRYNNYKGWGYSAGISSMINGIGNLNLSVDETGTHGSFTPQLSAATLLNQLPLEFLTQINPALTSTVLPNIAQILTNRANAYAQYSISNEARPNTFNSFNGLSANVKIELLNPLYSPPAGPNYGIKGNVTVQTPQNKSQRKAYGYMYSADANSEDVMDYYCEKDNMYSKRDRFLRIPFSNADYFNVSGEGIGGGFRMYHSHPGQFKPNKSLSKIVIGNYAKQPHFGSANFGLGIDIGLGVNLFRVNPWIDPNSQHNFQNYSAVHENVFFRMNNDQGGSLVYSDNDNVSTATLDQISPIWGFESYDVQMPSSVKSSNNKNNRSSYIGYSTYEDLSHGFIGGTTNYQAYDNRNAGNGNIRTNKISDKRKIAEMAIDKDDGSRYIFGLPVFSRKEKNIQYGLSELRNVITINNHISYAHVTPENASVVVGEERDGYYASTYLLTGITTPDYVDRRMDGLTSDDFGGYTKFSYIKTAGENVNFSELNNDPSQQATVTSSARRFSFPIIDKTAWANQYSNDNNDWYKWRVPYNGLLYSNKSLSDEKDDMGSMSMGEKEVYYLSTIETKTHIAVFVTNGGIYTHNEFFPGSGEHRKDGYEAVHHEYDVTGNPNATRANNGSVQQPNQLRRLERIELWSKDESGNLNTLLQKTFFEYDYSLCPGLPNSYKEINQNKSNGKLTLRRVYSEYNGVTNHKINPYVFGYEYRTNGNQDYSNLPIEVKNKYNSIVTYADNVSPNIQNPDYNSFLIGRWGGHQYQGDLRHEAMNPWENQKNVPLSLYDPASWELKWIRLPSGGEIQVQYEQNNYSYVQDQVAMVMVPLSAINITNQKYYLNIDDVFDYSSASFKDSLVDILKHFFIDKKEKMFFKIFHSLANGAVANYTNADNGESDYITGYANIGNVGIEPNGSVFIQMGAGSGSYSTPSQVAENFINTSRKGIVGFKKLNKSTDQDPHKQVQSVISYVNSNALSPSPYSWSNNSIDPQNSYIRIPLGIGNKILRAKKATGVRVKRLLMMDKGLENSGSHLFGTEYLYIEANGQSSGVATNEPAEGNEESSLVKILEQRQEPNWLEKILSGKDKDQFEGPLGESLLPSPVIHYGRVVARNIHSGETSSGFTISEYYTSKDYPSQCIYGQEGIASGAVSELDPETDFQKIEVPYFTYNVANIWATQGYKFISNNIAGQVKKISTYGGNYNFPLLWNESSSQEYQYFNPGEKIPMLLDYSVNPTFSYQDPGKEMEVVSEGRSVEDITIDAGISLDPSISIVPLLGPPFIAIVPILTFGSANSGYSEQNLKTHVTCKVIRYPAIVKKTISRQDGIAQTVENIGFSPLTGQPVVVKSTDGYTGLVLERRNDLPNTANIVHNKHHKSFSFPAAQHYQEMGQKATNERAVIFSVNNELQIDKRYGGYPIQHYLNFRNLSPGTVCTASDYLCAGDLIELFTATDGKYDTHKSHGFFYVDRVVGNQVVLQLHSLNIPTYIVDGVSIRVVRSGKTNQLTIPRSNITVYDP